MTDKSLSICVSVLAASFLAGMTTQTGTEARIRLPTSAKSLRLTSWIDWGSPRAVPATKRHEPQSELGGTRNTHDELDGCEKPHRGTLVEVKRVPRPHAMTKYEANQILGRHGTWLDGTPRRWTDRRSLK
jgi:hypothetical protein